MKTPNKYTPEEQAIYDAAKARAPLTGTDNLPDADEVTRMMNYPDVSRLFDILGDAERDANNDRKP